MAELESCQSLDVPAIKSGALDGIEQARDDCHRVNFHFGFCAYVMTAPESLLKCTIGLRGGMDPPFHFQICRVGVCNSAAQVIERLGCLQWFFINRDCPWRFNGHWRRLIKQLGLRYVDL